MIVAWLMKSAFGVPRWIFVLVGAAVLLVGAWVWIVKSEEADDRRNQEIGAVVEREEALKEAVERVETGNEAREEINRNDDLGDRLRYRQCLRSARTPANCDRYLLPERPADQR